MLISHLNPLLPPLSKSAKLIPMRNQTVTICLAIAVLLGSVNAGKVFAHDGSYEITFDNWVKNTPSIKDLTKDIGETEVSAICNKRTNYNELIIGNGKSRIEFNKHFRYLPKNEYWIKNKKKNGKYSMTIWWWVNTVAIKTDKIKLIWHGEPKLSRWNTKLFDGSEITDQLFLDLVKEEKFTIYVELNPVRYPQKHFGNYNRIYKTTLKLRNPEIIKECMN